MLKIKKIIVGSIEANCYLVWDEDSLEAVIIDPGADADVLIKEIKVNNLNIKYIINTHGHADHIAANNQIKDFCQDAKIVIHQADADFLVDNHKNLSAFFGEDVTSYKAEILVKEGDILDFSGNKLHVLETPGHTMGSICLILNNEAIFTGDTLFYGGIGRTDFSHSSGELMIQSLQKLKGLNRKFKVYPGHGPNTYLDFEIENNPFID